MNMKNNLDTVFNKAKELKLDTKSRESLKHTLEIYMRQNPLPPKKTFLVAAVEYYRTYPFVTLALAIFLIFGGTALAAKQSLPGDVLYPVKIANEKVESAFAIGPKATALVEVDQAAERLQEAEELSTVTPLATSTEVQLQTDFDTHVTAVSENITALKASGDYTAASDVEATLQNILNAHHRGFLTINATSSLYLFDASSTASSTLPNYPLHPHHPVGGFTGTSTASTTATSSDTVTTTVTGTSTSSVDLPDVTTSSTSVSGDVSSNSNSNSGQSSSNSATSNNGTTITVPSVNVGGGKLTL